MERHEQNLREILAATKHFLRKNDDRFDLKVIDQPNKKRYVIQIIMGRQEFQEYYTLRYDHLWEHAVCQHYCNRFGTDIMKNLKLHKIYYK